MVLVVYIVVKVLQKTEAIGNWSHLFHDFHYDPDTFYDLVIKTMRERKVPDFAFIKLTLKEGGLLSHSRLYLQVSRGDFIFHICAAPWGTGYFFSWWLRQKMNDIDQFLILIPFVGSRIVKLRQYQSYYKLDTDSMFKKSVHQCVLAAIDSLTSAKGVRGMSELERSPDMRSIIK